MRSLYDDIIATLEGHTFTIPNVQVRKPFSEADKNHPLVVAHEIVNLGKDTATVTGEGRTVLAYQFDIHTRDCKDTNGVVLGRVDAGRRLVGEIADLLATTYSAKRTSVRPPQNVGVDVVMHQLRVECVLDSLGYTYTR